MLKYIYPSKFNIRKKRSGTVVRLGKDGDTQVRTKRIVRPVRKLEHEAESSIEKKYQTVLRYIKE